MEISGVPPSTNRGVQNTGHIGLTALVDWVSVTFSRSIDWEEIAALMDLDKSTFKTMKTGINGYKGHVRRGHIGLLFDGGHVDMGVHLIMSGQGCREFENDFKHGWHEFFRRIFTLDDAHFTRLDLAIDDIQMDKLPGFFTPDQIVKKLEKGLVSSKFKSYRYMKKGAILDGKGKGATVYLGSPTSAIQIRIYDKLEERKAAGKEIESGVTHWVRTEIQLADQRADLAAQQIIFELAHNGTPIGPVIAGILKNYMSIYQKQKEGDVNKSRWPLWAPWEKFLGDVAKQKLTAKAPDRTIGTRRAWIDRQTAKTLGMLFLAYESDLNWLIDTLNKGMDLLEEKELDEVETYKRNKALIDKYLIQARLESGGAERFASYEKYIAFRNQLLRQLGEEIPEEPPEIEEDFGPDPEALEQIDMNFPFDYSHLWRS
jgi:phage replication initiation protein